MFLYYLHRNLLCICVARFQTASEANVKYVTHVETSQCVERIVLLLMADGPRVSCWTTAPTEDRRLSWPSTWLVCVCVVPWWADVPHVSCWTTAPTEDRRLSWPSTWLVCVCVEELVSRLRSSPLYSNIIMGYFWLLTLSIGGPQLTRHIFLIFEKGSQTSS